MWPQRRLIVRIPIAHKTDQSRSPAASSAYVGMIVVNEELQEKLAEMTQAVDQDCTTP
jgi:hypothetical protein